MKWFNRPSRDPLWQDEFSINAADERYVSRRQFTKFLVLTSLGMFAGNLWILTKTLLRGKPSFPRQTVAKVGEIPVGGVKLFRYPGPNDPCILIRPDESTYVAYVQKCTHLSCPVYYSKQDNRLECPCHEGYFSVKNGDVLQGPPPRPLPRVELERQGDELLAISVVVGKEI